MSVVVAIKDNDRVWVGADSQASGNGNKYTLKNKNNFKIFKPMNNDKLIIGVVGNIRDTNILSVIDDYIDELTILKNEVDFKYVVKTIVPRIMRELNNHNRLSKTNDLYNHMSSNILFVYDNSIYSIEGNGGVIEHDDYCVLGSGEDYALGYITQADVEDKKELLVSSIKSSCQSNLYVSYPIVIMNTKDEKVEIIEK